MGRLKEPVAARHWRRWVPAAVAVLVLAGPGWWAWTRLSALVTPGNGDAHYRRHRRSEAPPRYLLRWSP